MSSIILEDMFIRSGTAAVTEEAPDVEAAIAARVRTLRAARGDSLDGLAARSGVSRSMISLIERGEASPTATVLVKLAAALDVKLSALFEPPAAPAAPVSRRADQRRWRDPESGYERRNLSPPGVDSAVELVEVVFGAGREVRLDAPSRPPFDQQIWLVAGSLEIAHDGETHRLAAGDCLAMRVTGPVGFRNPGRQAARYIVAVATGRNHG